MNLTFYKSIFGISIFLFISVAFSCSNAKHPKLSKADDWNWSRSFPENKFSRVILYVLDSSVKESISTDEGSRLDTATFLGTGSFRFINENGIPRTNRYRSYQLDSSQIRRLQGILTESPCSDSIRVDKACTPVFRNVFIFYDENKKQVAQFHVCFTCELTYFYPEVKYMCNFDNTADFKRLRLFTEEIKK